MAKPHHVENLEVVEPASTNSPALAGNVWNTTSLADMRKVFNGSQSAEVQPMEITMTAAEQRQPNSWVSRVYPPGSAPRVSGSGCGTTSIEVGRSGEVTIHVKAGPGGCVFEEDPKLPGPAE